MAEVGAAHPFCHRPRQSPADRLLRFKPVCVPWRPIAEERRPADGHTKTGLPLRRRPAVASRWADGIRDTRGRGVRVRAGHEPALVAVLVAVPRRPRPFEKDRRAVLVQVERIGTAESRAANAVWVSSPSGVQIPEPPQFRAPLAGLRREGLFDLHGASSCSSSCSCFQLASRRRFQSSPHRAAPMRSLASFTWGLAMWV